MTFQGIQKLAEQRKTHRQRRKSRRLTQFNLKFLLVLMAVAGVVCWKGPTTYSRLHAKYDQLMVPYRLQQELILRMKQSRPTAAAYRNEKHSTTELGSVLYGDCLINGSWHRYEVRSRNGIIRRALVFP